MKKILFVTYGGGHVDIVIQLVKEIEKTSNIKYSILALTTARKVLDNVGIESKSCKDYIEEAGYLNAIEIGKELANDFWSPSLSVSYEETVSYLGVSMVDLISCKGNQGAFNLYEEQGRSVFCPVDFLTKVLDVEKPDVVVTTCYVRMEKAAVLAAKNIDGVKSVLIDDLLGSAVLGENIFAEGLIAHLSQLPDKICVLNEAVKNLISNAGVPKKNIFITGQPVFSSWLERYNNISISPSLEETVASYDRVVTYITTGCKDIFKKHVSKIISESKEQINWMWVIKLHPSISLEEYKDVFPNSPINIKVYGNSDILEICKISDVLVLHSSTVGLASLFFNIPLIIMNDDKIELQGMPYVKTGAGVQVRSHESLVSAIDDRLSSKNKSKPISPLFFNTPNAASNIISVLGE